MRLIDVLMGDEALFDMDVIDGNLDIAGLTCDSRAVRPGYVFAALPGARVDGRDYIQSAQEKGAVAVLAPVGTRAEIPVIEDANVRQRFARMAANFLPASPKPSPPSPAPTAKPRRRLFCARFGNMQAIRLRVSARSACMGRALTNRAR